jgi:replicative DNA helicase
MNHSLPHNLEAERALLGSLLVYPQSLKTVNELGIMADSFFLETHGIIFNAMNDVTSSGKNVDATTLLSRLEDMSMLSRVGGVEGISSLLEGSTSNANIKYYAQIILDKAMLRSLILTAEDIASKGFKQEEDLDEVLDYAERLIMQVTRNRRATDFRNPKEIINEVMDTISRMSSNKSNITGLKTSYKDLDKVTNGFQKGDLIILAARPSMGKTAFALNLGLQVARHNQEPVAIFSLEMPAEQLIMRMLSANAAISGSQLRSGYLNGAEWNKLNEAANDLRMLPIYVDDTPGMKVSEIFSKCRKLKAEQGLGMVIIDYIQLINASSSKNSENRQQEVSEISRALKGLAREMRIPVIALSQLSRLVDRRDDKRPLLSDLRESGALEQDADIVMFLYRDEYYNKKAVEQEQQEVEVDVAKHRNGPTRMIKLAFNRNFSVFYNLMTGEQE